MARHQKSVRDPVPRAARPGEQAPTDAELIERIRRSDESAFTQLYERYFDRVFGFAYLRLRSREDTEEVVQEIFTAVFRSIDGYRGQSSLASWIYGVAKNNVNNHIRRASSYEQRLARAEAELHGTGSDLDCWTPEEQLGLERCQQAVCGSLTTADDWHAEAFVLRHFQDLSVGEISKRLSRSNDAVRSSLYRMKKALVEAVESGIPVSG